MGGTTMLDTSDTTLKNVSKIAIGGTTITDVNLLNIQGDGSTKNVGIVLNKTNSTAQIWSMQVNNTTGGLYFHNYTASNTPVAITTGGDVKIGNLNTSATSAPLFVAKSSTDVQAIFGDNNSSIDDPSIRIIGRNTANNAIKYLSLIHI